MRVRDPAASRPRSSCRPSTAALRAATASPRRASASASRRSRKRSASSSRCALVPSLPRRRAPSAKLTRAETPRLAPPQRFEITSAAHKLDTPVRYPLKLDMAPYLTTNLEYPAAYKPCVVPLPPRLLLGGSRVRALITPVARRSDAHRFNLMAVIAHEGTLSQGHYTAYVRGSDDVRLPPSRRPPRPAPPF